MGLLLKIISGEQAGQIFPITGGAIIGRAQVDIYINDPKISGKHAKFETDPNGRMKIMDLGSTNGIYVEDKRVVIFDVTPGVKLRVGSTFCEVLSAQDGPANTKEIAKNGNSTEAPAPELDLPPLPDDDNMEIEVQTLTWSEYLSDLSRRWQNQVKSKPQVILPFQTLLRLRCIRGLHMGQSWEIGYGPREVGRASLDIQIMEDDCPEVAFTLSPEDGRVRFQTKFTEKVKLNGVSKDSEILNDGAEIHINGSLFRLDFIK